MIWAFGEIGLRTAEPWLGKRLESEEGEPRVEVCRALRKIGGPRAEAMLISCLLDENDEVQRTSIEALGHIGGAKALAALEQIAASQTFEHMKDLLDESLARLRKAGAAISGSIQDDFFSAQ